jgi:molecular chaperone GrpE
MNDDLNKNQTIQDDLNQDVEAVEQEVSDSNPPTQNDEYNSLKDSYARLLAELVNTKRNVTQDIQQSKRSLLLKIIAIIDNYSMVLEQDKSQESCFEDLKNLVQQLQILLATEGVTKIDIKVGDDFDPSISEAISTQEAEDEGKILAVVSPAYKMDSQIIKTAKIIVSRKG